MHSKEKINLAKQKSAEGKSYKKLQKKSINRKLQYST